jgi:hypothetical protein
MTTETEKAKRKVHRSPSYPVFDLAEAIQKAATVYKEEKRSATTLEVIASHMGYSQANGPGGRAVSALRQYGLIEENAGQYQISDAGYILIHFERTSEEWKRTVSEAVRKPVLFKELLEKYGNGLPSDATLRNELLGRGFNPSSISDVVLIFRNTMALAGEFGGGYNDREERTPMPETTSVRPNPILTPPAQLGEKRVSFNWPVSKDVIAEVTFRGGEVNVSHLKNLAKYLELMQGAIDEMGKEN